MKRVIKAVSVVFLVMILVTGLAAMWKGHLLWSLVLALAAALGLSAIVTVAGGIGAVATALFLGWLIYGLKADADVPAKPRN